MPRASKVRSYDAIICQPATRRRRPDGLIIETQRNSAVGGMIVNLVSVRRLILGLALLAALMPVTAFPQAQVPVYGDGPIPETGFTSWSLFLMCNPEWL